MIIKYDRNNTNFQIAYFIAGSCHTADAAYIALLSLKQDREQALAAAKVSDLKKQAAVINATKKTQDQDPAEQLLGQAELLEIQQQEQLTTRLIAAAQSELEFINQCIAQVQPLRKYGHLSDHEAAEACQKDEWLGELCYRAENYMLTAGSIPHDHFATMRQHPDFAATILPRIEQIHLALATPEQGRNLLIENRKFNLPALLGMNKETNEQSN